VRFSPLPERGVAEREIRRRARSRQPTTIASPPGRAKTPPRLACKRELMSDGAERDQGRPWEAKK
jgi:hypothetical protein